MQHNPDRGGHFYTKDGKPSHDSDLRDARKEGLLRSVTSIDKDMFTNPFLEQWKQDQVAIAAFNNPRQPHENEDDYTARIMELSWEKSRTAAEFGTKLHDAIEGLGVRPVEDPALIPFVDRFVEWQKVNIVAVVTREETLVDLDIGVAGRMDAEAIHAIEGQVVVDYKTQNVKKDKKGKKTPAFYPGFPRQLAFYSAALAKKRGMFPVLGKAMSIIIDSNEPCEPFVKVYGTDELKEAYEDFIIAAYGYYKKKKYWPVGQWNLCDKINQLNQP